MRAISPKARLFLAASTATVYVVGFMALAVWGFMLWRMYCEGLGCIGKGIAWFAWAFGYAAALVLGQMARRTYQGAGHWILRYLLALQAAIGIALVVYWAVWRAA